MRLELGAGKKGTPGYTHHDKWKHSPEIDVAHDLEMLPWPWAEDSIDHLLAIDCLEHLRPWKVAMHEWLAECWRILKFGGILETRLPAYENPYTWRDPQHTRGYHAESMNYFCPNLKGDCFGSFGAYYFGEQYFSWWWMESVMRDCGDLRFTMRKHLYADEELNKIKLAGRK